MAGDGDRVTDALVVGAEDLDLDLLARVGRSRSGPGCRPRPNGMRLTRSAT